MLFFTIPSPFSDLPSKSAPPSFVYIKARLSSSTSLGRRRRRGGGAISSSGLAMDSSKMSPFLIILMIFISSTPFALACGTCKPPSKSGKGTPTIGLPPVTLPPVTLPPVVTNPPVTLPPVTLPPVVTNPPVKLPPVTLPPVTLPPVTLPPVTLPPVGTPPVVVKPGCSPPAKKKTCPVNTLKLNACVDLLGGLVHLNIGKATSTCCPLLEGLAGVDAALCLCTTIKAKLLNINLALPIALELLVSCGKTPPSGFTCA